VKAFDELGETELNAVAGGTDDQVDQMVEQLEATLHQSTETVTAAP
jgi:hypothetical protein